MAACMSAPIEIKLVIFDLDGVLIDSRELHYEALNRALNEIDPSYVIGRQEHLAKYDGSPTSVKLHMLTSEKGLPINRHTEVWKLKQEKTFEVINDTFTTDNRLRTILAALKKDGYKLYCASNSIFNTIKLMLLRKGILEYFDYILSCEDVRNPKPSPQIYVQCCLRAGISPKEALILEDSHVGRKAALLSGCHLLPVEDPTSVTLKAIKSTIDHINATQGASPMQIKWRQPVNVVVPMCAELQEFAASGYTFPQFLVELNKKPIVQIVTENLNIEGRFIFVVSRRDYDKYSLKYVLRVISPHSTVIIAENPTDGALCSVLLAKDLINNETPLVVANCQQLLDWDSNSFMYAMSNKEVDGGILTFANTHPRFSYVTINDDGFVTEVAEKKPISNIATAGVYMFKRGADLVAYGTAHMESGKPGPHYIAPIYNNMIADQKKIRIKPCPNRWNLALPKDIDYFLKNYVHVDKL